MRRQGAPWADPPRQPDADEHLHRPALEGPTPVVGGAQPPRGLSGLMRRRAYTIPEHYARHWMILMAADRVDVVEDRLGELMARPLENAGLHAGARRVREQPLGIALGAVLGVWLAKKAVF